MTVKEWLGRGYRIEKEIQTLSAEKAEALTRMTGAAAGYEGERVQTSPGNVQERKLLNYAAYNEIIDARIDELYKVKGEILNAVNKVGDARLRQLLEYRYVRFMKWERIAHEMNYSYKHVVHVLHPKALAEIEKYRAD